MHARSRRQLIAELRRTHQRETTGTRLDGPHQRRPVGTHQQIASVIRHLQSYGRRH